MLPNAIIGAGLVVVGLVIALLGAYQLGLARAAAKWDNADRGPRVGRGVATAGVGFGLALIGGGGAVLSLLIPLPGETPAVRVVVAVLVALAAVLVFMFLAARIADRVELNALIRTPSRFRRLSDADSQPASQGPDGATPEPASDPIVPPTARPGWVYRDAGGAWYLVVASGAGYRMVSLPDFKLMPVGMVKGPVTATGSVELAVWPLTETPGVREGDVHSNAT
ncbi:MAG: hypothetical protein ACRDT6_27270 [Micromonosporaceae bacterium]